MNHELGVLLVPLLVITPDSNKFATAVDCWNEYLAQIKKDRNPADWQLRVQNNHQGPINFDPTRSRIFADGIVESTHFITADDGNNYRTLYTQALINHDLLVLAGPKYRHTEVDRIKLYIASQFESKQD